MELGPAKRRSLIYVCQEWTVTFTVSDHGVVAGARLCRLTCS